MVIYPNPSRGIIEVKMNGYNGFARFIITNSLGQVVIEKDQTIYGNNTVQFSLDKQAKGVYWLEMQINNENSLGKIVVY